MNKEKNCMDFGTSVSVQRSAWDFGEILKLYFFLSQIFIIAECNEMMNVYAVFWAEERTWGCISVFQTFSATSFLLQYSSCSLLRALTVSTLVQGRSDIIHLWDTGMEEEE